MTKTSASGDRLYDSIVDSVPQLKRGKVWCIQCGKMRGLDSADALRNGWPECCGQTMTIDSPQWRYAHGLAVGTDAGGTVDSAKEK